MNDPENDPLIEHKRVLRLNWWPPVTEDLTCVDELVIINDFPRWVPAWSDGIFRIKLVWPDQLIEEQ